MSAMDSVDIPFDSISIDAISIDAIAAGAIFDDNMFIGAPLSITMLPMSLGGATKL